jgi:hypothetical protein
MKNKKGRSAVNGTGGAGAQSAAAGHAPAELTVTSLARDGQGLAAGW